MESWYDHGYVFALKDDYRLILLDARGHAASDKPHRLEAYELKKWVEDIVAVLDDLGIAQARRPFLARRAGNPLKALDQSPGSPDLLQLLREKLDFLSHPAALLPT
jgi:hypothetical protein